ncbi:hypothetical protein TcBrA4_0033180 [Trypanosoma cruzi]|nr:hypothetical protein TcBrA4_0033180 [Trypanosoma cruzi]
MLRSALSVTLCQSKYVKRRQPRRATHHAMSSTKLGKGRFDLAEALYRDRQRVENKPNAAVACTYKANSVVSVEIFFCIYVVVVMAGDLCGALCEGHAPT